MAKTEVKAAVKLDTDTTVTVHLPRAAEIGTLNVHLRRTEMGGLLMKIDYRGEHEGQWGYENVATAVERVSPLVRNWPLYRDEFEKAVAGLMVSNADVTTMGCAPQLLAALEHLLIYMGDPPASEHEVVAEARALIARCK